MNNFGLKAEVSYRSCSFKKEDLDLKEEVFSFCNKRKRNGAS